MQESNLTGKGNGRGRIIAAAAVSLIACTAVSIIAIINNKMPLGGVFAVLAVCSHLLLWWQINQSHKDRAGTSEQAG